MQKLKEIVKQAFTRNGKPFMPYIYIWLMLVLIVIAVVMRFIQAKISDTLVLGLCGFVVTWLGILMAGKK